jgi:hypothetical protein
MSAKELKDERNGKSVKLRVDGRSVSLSFAEQADTAIAQRIRNCLIDSYIRQNGGLQEKTA